MKTHYGKPRRCEICQGRGEWNRRGTYYKAEPCTACDGEGWYLEAELPAISPSPWQPQLTWGWGWYPHQPSTTTSPSSGRTITWGNIS